MPDLDIQSKMTGDNICVIKLSGFLDAHTFEDLDEVMNDLFDQDIFKIVAILEGIEYISSAGAGVFIGALTTAQESGGNIILVNPQESVYEVFELLGLVEIFTIADDVKSAIGSF